MMKRILALLTAAALTLTLAACGAPATPKDDPGSSATSAPQSGASGTASGAGEAGSWEPEKAVQCIVPFAAGGGSDVLTRLIMKYLDMPADMVAVNVDGGAGLVGGQQCAAAPADGYTLLAHNPMNLISQGLTGTSELWNELTPLAFVVDDWTMVCTNKASGWSNAEEFVAYAKEHPGEIKWGVTGTPIIIADSYRAMEGLGIDCTIVPYDGGNETQAALMGDHIQIEVATASEIRGYVESGDVVPLFAIAPNRCPFMAEVPTLIDLGIQVDSGAPRAYFAPGNLDPAIVAYYEQKFREVCENEEFVKACADLGFVVQFVGAEEASTRMRDWYEDLKPVFEKYGLSA